ncbi:MAG: GGDEF domain-containing protein [Oscillospiraceae bacterium]
MEAKTNLKSLSKEERRKFYQSKYDYYRTFTTGLMIVSVIAYLSFFFTDCGIFGRFAYETLLSRGIILVPFAIYLIMERTIRDYRIMVPAYYVLIHCIIWFTDWSTYLLPDRQHAISGMIIMNLIFVCAGFAAPFRYSMTAHLLLLADIAIAHQFIHYDNLAMMFMFNIPCVIAIVVMHYLMQNVYFEQYITKHKLQKMVMLDQLTEVGNRNRLKEICDPVTSELCFPAGTEVSVLLMDIDFFKRVNDELGHEAGDKVLVFLAQKLKSLVRSTDYIIRWGGEEFLILMPNCAITQAAGVAEKIRENVEKADSGVCKITVSIGVAAYKGGDYHEVIKNADEAMYQAKRSGRNRVVLFEEA